jgi:hypothetical protein
MPFLKTSFDGELFTDHSASPGIPAERARQLDLPPEMVSEGKRMTAATVGCPHCASAVVLNPLRIRERAHCYICNRYICDGCDMIRHEPDYVHTTAAEVVEKVKSGRFILVGSIARGKLISIGGMTNG